jgi:cytidine deaminase
MDISLDKKEKQLITHAKDAVIKYNRKRHKACDFDVLYSFILTDSGSIIDGACFEAGIAHADVCGERHAIANMVLQKSYKEKIGSIVVADAVPREQPHGRFPCGTCRNLIYKFGLPETSVLLLQYIRDGENYTFPKIEKFTISELYPYPYEPPKNLWD